MVMVQVNQDLQDTVREAMKQPYRFERTERFAMNELLLCAGRDGLVDQIFVDKARDALRRHGSASRDWAIRGHPADDCSYSDAMRIVMTGYTEGPPPFGSDPAAVNELNIA